MIRSIDVALAALDGHGKKGDVKMEDLFEGFNPSQYEEEARDRWGSAGRLHRIGETDQALHARRVEGHQGRTGSDL